MLGTFPLARRDEDLSSLIARAYDRWGRPSQRAILRELFGPANTIASLEFPSGLRHLVQALPPNHPLRLDTLISKHTRLPYYAPFLASQRVKGLKADMAGNGGQGMLRRAGLATNRPALTPFFRHCPQCDSEDYTEAAERYWHLLHQLPGVEVCPEHYVWLENSTAQTRNRSSRLEYMSAERSIHITRAQPFDADSSEGGALLQIAKDSAWLLANGLSLAGYEWFRKRYLELLRDRGFMSYRGKLLNVEGMVSQFTSYYGPRLLTQLGCYVSTSADHSWLVRLVRRNEDGAQHPLRHLLFIQWLGLTAQQFFVLQLAAPDYGPFGGGPWLCRNPVCPQRDTPTITECTISYSGQTGSPIGTCACPVCHYTYRLTGSSRDKQDAGSPARADQVVDFGPLWEDALVSLCADDGVPVKRKAQRLGLDYETLCQMAGARRLVLAGPRGVITPWRDATGRSVLAEDTRLEQVHLHREA